MIRAILSSCTHHHYDRQWDSHCDIKENQDDFDCWGCKDYDGTFKIGDKIEMAENRVLKAAQIVRGYCLKHDNCSDGCIFGIKDDELTRVVCGVDDIPCDWILKGDEQ